MKYVFVSVWICSALILSSQSQVAYKQLPELIRHKSEMMPKGKFLGIVYGTAVVMNTLFAGAAILMPLFSRKILLNSGKIPNKGYWLKTPERLEKAGNRMSCGLLWFCLVINGVFWYIIDLTIRSARAGVSQPISGSIITMILAGFLAGIVYQHFAFRVPRG